MSLLANKMFIRRQVVLVNPFDA